MTGHLRLVLGDQLTATLSALRDLDPARDVVLLAEVRAETEYVPHHPQKIALVLSAMRHFAADLRARGVTVRYVALDEPGNSGSLLGEVGRAVADFLPEAVVITEPGEWRLFAEMQCWGKHLGLPVEIRTDDRFLTSRADFAAWMTGRKAPRMEHFYREIRRRTGLLMTADGKPKGGAWNYDADNRKALKPGTPLPPTPLFPPDRTTQAVLDLVGTRFGHHFGRLEGFNWPATRIDALRLLDHFIRAGLPAFGDYQDAMQDGEPFLFHSRLSAALNIGLLEPLEVCRAAEDAYRHGLAPLNAAEGFIRQIIGWREYVRGIYWHHMPDYATLNALCADRSLPAFYWGGETDMNCLSQAIGQTRDHAYAHHIQRLMVTGNFALLLGVNPREVGEWYLAVYADAYEWVEMPNTHGMALFADGGVMASKPYAASGKYIDRMSNHCASCRYDVKSAEGEHACPFNALYWDFIARNEDRLARNPRMAMIYRSFAKMAPARRDALRARAQTLRDQYAPRSRRPRR